jgi:hypothetical protein
MMAKTKPKQDGFEIEAVLSAIGDGKSLTQIAKDKGTTFGVLQTWLESDPERSARAREARENQARYWDELAEAGIAEASDPFRLARAKELAHHYRWRAAKIAPKHYGERTTVAGDPDAPLLGQLSDEQLAAKVAALHAKVNGKA